MIREEEEDTYILEEAIADGVPLPVLLFIVSESLFRR